jgi:CPA2 family monovalent cation:H+ antiporter-2
MRQRARLLLIDTAFLATIIITTAVWGSRVADVITTSLSFPDRFAWLIVILAAVIFALPFCIGIVRCTARLARTLGAIALPETENRADLADAPRRALVITLEIALLLLVGIPLIAVTQPFLPPFPGPIIMVILILVLAIALWRSTTNLQEHARAGAQAIVEVLARQLGGKSVVTGMTTPDLEQLHRLLPGLGAPQPIRIRPGTSAVDKTLAELNLRGLTGATVLAIIREHDGVLIPTGRETLQAGDLLAVAGTADAIVGAEKLLTESAFMQEAKNAPGVSAS